MTNGSYFPLDLHFDSKMQLLEAEFGIKGFGVIIKLWQLIYSTEGYYVEWTEDMELLFAQNIRVGRSFVSEILKAAIKRGLFDEGMYTQYNILTSSGIQKRYFNMLKRHKEVSIKKDYLLVEVTQILKNVSILWENVNIQAENVNILKQNRIDRKDRLDKIRVEEKEASASDRVLHKYESLIGLATPAVAEGIEYYIAQGMEQDLVIRIIEYACEQGKRSWQYINAALLGNLKEDIHTLQEYNRKQAERIEKGNPRPKPKKSKFNNYTDTNKHDYSGLQEEILKEMLEG